MTEFRLVEYEGIKGYIIECRLSSTSPKLSKSSGTPGPWLPISNWSSPFGRQEALSIFRSLNP